MNFQEKNKIMKDTKDLFINSYPEGCIKITKQESEIHARVKLQVAYWLKQNDFKVYSEPNFKGYGRPDLVCLKNQHNYVIEIINSEKDKSIELKKDKYPIPLIVVNCKDFKYEAFKL